MIKGNSIYLRALEPEDIDLLFEWENNVDVWKISDTIHPFSRYTLEKYIASSHDIYSQGQLRLMICDIVTKEAIGCIDLFDFSAIHQRVGCGILIADEAERNKGFGSESISLITNYCFSILDCHQVYCNILENNLKSIKLFEKAGFQLIGVKKDWIKIEGKFYNELLYQYMCPES
ncbi:MAG: GNAT family N-acetyltransferase [Salibacteraceae bacterium]